MMLSIRKLTHGYIIPSGSGAVNWQPKYNRFLTARATLASAS
ncbi:hypothetical protein [Snodgrassella alvi]|nr:hypothetical protein [Snodgrassella alvi]